MRTKGDRSLTAGELYAHTKQREEKIRRKGYNIVTMRESDYVEAARTD